MLILSGGPGKWTELNMCTGVLRKQGPLTSPCSSGKIKTKNVRHPLPYVLSGSANKLNVVVLSSPDRVYN